MSTCEPSIPSHQKVWCGMRLVSFQDSFCVSSQRMPAARAICGRAAEYPNESGSQTPRHRTPSSASIQETPSTSWRTIDSPPGSMVSDSTHMPPTGTNRPSRTAATMRSNSSGSASFTQARCCADDVAKVVSGYSRSRARAFAYVRTTLRRVSRNGHSHAESMCACPTATT